VAVRINALVDRRNIEEIERDWGDSGGPEDRLIAEAARRATGVGDALGVAQMILEYVPTVHYERTMEGEPDAQWHQLYLGVLMRHEYEPGQTIAIEPSIDGIGEIAAERVAREIGHGTALGEKLARHLFRFAAWGDEAPPPKAEACPDGPAGNGTTTADRRRALYDRKTFVGTLSGDRFVVTAGKTKGVLHWHGSGLSHGLTTVDEIEGQLVRGEIRRALPQDSLNEATATGTGKLLVRRALAKLTGGASVTLAHHPFGPFWSGQYDIMRALDLAPFVAVTKGYKTGATHAAAAIALWWTLNVDGGQVLVAMETKRLLERIFSPIFMSLLRHVQRPPSWGLWKQDGPEAAAYRREQELHRGTLRLVWQSALADACEGMYAPDRTLIIVDGARCIERAGGLALDMALFLGANVLAMDVPMARDGAPGADGTGRDGWFWNLFHKNRRGGAPTRVILSAEDAAEQGIVGLMTQEWINKRRIEFGSDYERTASYRAHVLGQFPLEAP
jgi:hypothetical protein